MNYSEAVSYLYSRLPMFQRDGSVAFKAGLGRTLELCEYFGNPHHTVKTIHIAGTNGKGSTSHMLASVLQAAGYKTGLYTSPHLKDFRERIKINGEMIQEETIARYLQDSIPSIQQLDPSFFEITFCFAMRYFKEKDVDIAVIETGMGGRLDSTNIIRPVLSLITNISLDHVQFLGNTLPKIAGEKAGIIKHQIPVIIGESQEQTESVFIEKAEKESSPIYFSDKIYAVVPENKDVGQIAKVYDVYRNGELLYSKLKCGLFGDYQAKNLPAIFKASDILNDKGYNISEAAIRTGIERVVNSTGLMGRWQKLSDKPLVICDTGHNEAGIEAVVAQINKMKFKKLHFVLGMVKEKDVVPVLMLLPTDATYYFCKPDLPRGMDQHHLAELARGLGLVGNTYESVKSALKEAKKAASPDDLVFAGGSTFVVAEII